MPLSSLPSLPFARGWWWCVRATSRKYSTIAGVFAAGVLGGLTVRRGAEDEEGDDDDDGVVVVVGEEEEREEGRLPPPPTLANTPGYLKPLKPPGGNLPNKVIGLPATSSSTTTFAAASRSGRERGQAPSGRGC